MKSVPKTHMAGVTLILVNHFDNQHQKETIEYSTLKKADSLLCCTGLRISHPWCAPVSKQHKRAELVLSVSISVVFPTSGRGLKPEVNFVFVV